MLRYKKTRLCRGSFHSFDTDEGSVLHRNSGTDTGIARCHSTEVRCLRYFAYGKERDQLSMNTGELQISVILGLTL